jgi:transcription initiation factor TFIIH subunit 1
MTTCHTAANEFLRQFWLSIYPPPNALSTSMTTPAQKAAKAAKMIGYLEKTGEKVDSIVQSAVEEGVDANAVQTVRRLLEI